MESETATDPAEGLSAAEVGMYRPSLRDRFRWWRQRLISRQKIANWVFWVWRKLAPTGNYVKHAEREFEILGWSGRNDDDPQTWICEGTLDLLKVFAAQGHSGSSVPYALSVFKAVVMFNPIGPLTGKDEEWAEPYCEDGIQQNRRCSDVFRNADGQVYWTAGRVFRDPDGCCYTSIDSRVDIEFPWTKPDKPEYVDVTE